MKRAVLGWAAAGGIASALLPWYAIEDGTFGFGWLSGYPTDGGVAPALVQVLRHGRLALLPVAVFLLAPLAVRGVRSAGVRAALLLTVGAGGTAWIAVQGFAVGGQPGIGLGGLVVFAALLMLFCVGLAATGAFNGDRFISGRIGAIVALVVVFVFFPVSRVLVGAVEGSRVAFAPREFWAKLSAREVWGLDCLGSSAGCGVAWNTLILGLLVGASTTALGLAFALIVTRTGFRAKKALRLLTVLPLITPPFVIGLAVILLFGRAGAVTTFMESAFGVVPSRWIYGLQGVLVAQIFAFTPIAFLVLIGVVEGVSPSMEEAAQTLRADRWRTFVDVSLPLMRPGIANAFLISFIESVADFGNPIPWALLTIVIYAMALVGGFVETWGRDYTPTLEHYVKAFGVEWGAHGILWTGAAWNSFWTTVKLSAIAAPLTAGLGILAAYLLTRQRFVGQATFEFGTMLSFAIPGTVIGVSYILAFNVPPIEITGTALILVVCNIFRNMPVGVRAGMAAMTQIDQSLDEASTTLGARGFTVLRTILLPLLKPAVV